MEIYVWLQWMLSVFNIAPIHTLTSFFYVILSSEFLAVSTTLSDIALVIVINPIKTKYV